MSVVWCRPGAGHGQGGSALDVAGSRPEPQITGLLGDSGVGAGSPWQSTASQVGCCLRPWLARAAGFEGMRRSFNPLVISHGEKERREEGMTSARNRTSDHHVETIVEEHSPHTGARAADSWSQ